MKRTKPHQKGSDTFRIKSLERGKAVKALR